MTRRGIISKGLELLRKTRGKEELLVENYDELDRTCTEPLIIEPGGADVAVSIPIGMWHTVHTLESGTCILEMKNGGYEPLKEEDILQM